MNLKNRLSSVSVCALLLIALSFSHISAEGANLAAADAGQGIIFNQSEGTQKDAGENDSAPASEDTEGNDSAPASEGTGGNDSAPASEEAGGAESEETDIAAPEYTGKSTGTTKYKGVDYRYVYCYDYYISKPYGKKYAGSPKKAIEHFVKAGMQRHQQAIASFDPVSYRLGCPALRTRYRDDYEEYYLHYMKTGHKYARYRKYAVGITKMRGAVTKYGKVELKSVYDYDYYIARYPSVVQKVGDDDRAVLKYFVEHGMKKRHEGRDPGLYPKADPSSSAYKALLKKIHKTGSFDGTGLIVCIDPGHQSRGDYSREAIGPGAGTTKPKVTSGAYGRYSRKNEYQINLEVGLKLEKELKARGYTVVMTRTTHDVHITNIERAKLANEARADIMVRIHANGIDGASSVNGVLCYAAANNNPYLSKKVIAKGQRLAALLRDCQAAATGQRKLSNLHQNDMTGINWAKMPCAIVEMGFMSNPNEDLRMANSGFQMKIAKGLADGIDRYFLEEKK